MSASAPAKKKVNRKDYMFNQLNGETVRKTPGQIDGLGFAIRYLENCHASLFDWSSQVSPHSANLSCCLQVMVDQVKNSTLVVGPCSGSVFFRDCENCTIYVACQQFRCRDLKK